MHSLSYYQMPLNAVLISLYVSQVLAFATACGPKASNTLTATASKTWAYSTTESSEPIRTVRTTTGDTASYASS